jgi:hypothetical protein
MEGRTEGIAGMEGLGVKLVSAKVLIALHSLFIKSYCEVELHDITDAPAVEQRKGYSTSLIFSTMAGASPPHVHDWILWSKMEPSTNDVQSRGAVESAGASTHAPSAVPFVARFIHVESGHLHEDPEKLLPVMMVSHISAGDTQPSFMGTVPIGQMGIHIFPLIAVPSGQRSTHEPVVARI